MHERDTRMYELQFPAPEVVTAGKEGPALIVAMQGYADAGQAVELGADYLLQALDHRLVATFNNDELIDYRSRRPAVTISGNSVVDSEELALDINIVKDSKGEHFLLLSGPEPDMRWEGFTNAVSDLVERFSVSETICLYAAPMTVPHTRPLVVSAHGNDDERLSSHFTLDSTMKVPGSASLMLEKVLGEKGKLVSGFTAHVPHYLAASSYPQATLALLEAVSSGTNLSFPLRALEEDAQKVRDQIEEQVVSSGEIQQVVEILEQQYDEELERYREKHPGAVLPGSPSIPSGEVLGAEFEDFLAQLDDHAIGGPGLEDFFDATTDSSSDRAVQDQELPHDEDGEQED